MTSLQKRQHSWLPAMGSKAWRHQTCLRSVEKSGREGWVEKNVTKAPELKSLPRTKEAFKENVKRAHIQTAIWKSALESEPPALDPVDFGWERDERTMMLDPSNSATKR